MTSKEQERLISTAEEERLAKRLEQAGMRAHGIALVRKVASETFELDDVRRFTARVMDAGLKGQAYLLDDVVREFAEQERAKGGIRHTIVDPNNPDMQKVFEVLR